MKKSSRPSQAVKIEKLPFSFYARPTKIVARDLLGKRLVRIYQGQRISGIITEVEAYLGVGDRAAHSYGDRRTARTEPMYLAGGHAYVYFIYGMYDCFNVVTAKAGQPQAVLIRALEPVEGLALMQKFRGKSALKDLTTGPGKLTQALAIHRSMSGWDLTSKDLFIENGPRAPASKIIKTTRIGVDYAGDHAKWPLRFYLRDNIFISKK